MQRSIGKGELMRPTLVENHVQSQYHQFPRAVLTSF